MPDFGAEKIRSLSLQNGFSKVLDLVQWGQNPRAGVQVNPNFGSKATSFPRSCTGKNFPS